VSERTEEIAIRRAFGARAKDIEIQFLIESIVLCTIGGIIGLLWGVLLSQILTLLVPVIKSVTTFNS
ncbi:FtsX-like permease family protein, partial [Staphylococcus argenteus]|nr:FtsX-like permease family protein [Staphylococcus argenteus]